MLVRTHREQKPLAIHCVPDHTRILVGFKPVE